MLSVRKRLREGEKKRERVREGERGRDEGRITFKSELKNI